MFLAIYKVVNSCYDEEKIKIWIFIIISVGLSFLFVGVIPFLFLLFSILAFHRTLDFEVIRKNKEITKKICFFISLLPILFFAFFLSSGYKEYIKDKSHITELTVMKDRLAKLQNEYNEADKNFSLNNQSKSFQKKHTELSLALNYSSFLLDSMEKYPSLMALNPKGESCLENRQGLPSFSYSTNRQEFAFSQDYFNSIYKECYSLNDLKLVVIPGLDDKLKQLSSLDVFHLNKDIEKFNDTISLFEKSRYISKNVADGFYSYLNVNDDLVFISFILLVLTFVYYWLYLYLYYVPMLKSKDAVISSLRSEREEGDIITRNISIIKGEKFKSYSVADELAKWHALNQQGVISDKEFQEAKDKLLK